MHAHEAIYFVAILWSTHHLLLKVLNSWNDCTARSINILKRVTTSVGSLPFAQNAQLCTFIIHGVCADCNCVDKGARNNYSAPSGTGQPKGHGSLQMAVYTCLADLYDYSATSGTLKW